MMMMMMMMITVTITITSGVWRSNHWITIFKSLVCLDPEKIPNGASGNRSPDLLPSRRTP